MQPRHSPGTMIAGRFRLEQPLGEGAYGEVWRATQLPVGRSVAVKLLKPSNDHFARQRFDREARAMAAISHPNCVTFLDFGHLPGDEGSFLVSELVEGEEMRAWMQRRPPLHDIISVCRQIAAALEAAHRQQVLHRDLKPENVMVRRDPQQGVVAKVLDFGLSKIVDDERRDITKTGEIFGTPGYMSPEQLRGNEIGPATDLYSFGVILYELLQGRPPFVAGTGHEVCMMHLVEAVPPITAQVPPPLAQLAMRLLTKDPRQRPGTAEASRILSGGLAGNQLPPPQQQFGAHPPSTMQQHPGGFQPLPPAQRQDTVIEPEGPRAPAEPIPVALIGIGAVVVLLMVGGIGFALLTDKPADPEVVPATKPPPAITKPIPSADVSAPSSDAQLSDAGPAQSLDAGTDCLPAGTHELQMPSTVPWALLQVPSVPTTPTPIVVLLHETAGQDPSGFAKHTEFFQRADERGAVVLAPADVRGLGEGGSFESLRQWQAVGEWIDVARRRACVPDGPVYVFGYGSGGWGAENIWCHVEGITATVTMSHRLSTEERLCETKPPIPRLALWPTKDGWDPVDGGSCLLGKKKQPLSAHKEALRKQHGCRGGARKLRSGKHKCETWSCKVPLEVCEIEAGRAWPGLERPSDLCNSNTAAADFPYDEVVWTFFEKHAPAE